jgi:replicative DNA helicase
MTSSDPFLRKGPPVAEIAEAAILTIAFENPEQYLPKLRSAGVSAETFFKHRRLYTEICRFYEENEALELVAFKQDLESRGMFGAVGGEEIIPLLAPSALTAYGWEKWVEQIREAHAQRIAYQLHQKPAEYENSEQAAAALKDALSAIEKAKSGPTRVSTGKAAVESFIEEFTKNRQAGTIPGFSTGIVQLDSISGGIRRGEFWVIAGKTSRGKSVLMLQISAEVLRAGGKVAIFSLEMSKEEIVGRLVSFLAGIDYGLITQPRELKKERDLEKLKWALQLIADSSLWIDDSAGQTGDHITAEAAALAEARGPLDLVTVDYLQLIDGDRKRGENREQEVARASRGLKQLAKRLKCPVLSGSQLNKEGEVRESQAIAQDANAILLIVEDGVKVGKMRNGPRGAVLPLILDGQHQRFVQRS